LLKPAECGLGLKWRELFALARNAPTPLLRRFFSPTGVAVAVAVAVTSGDGRPLPEELPLLPLCRLRSSLVGVGFSDVGGEGDAELGDDRLAWVDCGGADELTIPASISCRVSFAGRGKLEPLPNILPSNPPCWEKLLLCFPASVLTLVESACGRGIGNCRLDLDLDLNLN